MRLERQMRLPLDAVIGLCQRPRTRPKFPPELRTRAASVALALGAAANSRSYHGEFELRGVDGENAEFFFEDVRDVLGTPNQAGTAGCERGADPCRVIASRVGQILVHHHGHARKPAPILGQHHETCAPGGAMIDVIAQAHGNPQFVRCQKTHFVHQSFAKQ